MPPTIESLKLPGYDVYTRATYFAKFGKPAPPGDPTKRPKAWIGFGAFWLLDGFALRQVSIPETEQGVNIEGAGPYPAFVMQPTKATPVNGTSPINPLYLSLEADARALLSELRGVTGSFRDEGLDPTNPLLYPPEEKRREFTFLLANGVSINAGSFIYIKSIRGVGAPGQWDLTRATPNWVPDGALPLGSSPWPVPMRPLAPNESIEPGFGSVPILVVKDAPPAPAPAPASGDGYTQADRNRDNQILAYVTAIAKQRGIVL